MYDAINEHEELPNIDYPDSDASKAIVEFHACKYEIFANKSEKKNTFIRICFHET